VTFHIQDPGNPNTDYLIEILLEQCQKATVGGASFAWATARGINLLLENPQFSHFLHEFSFDLILGVDAVTDEAALQVLCRLQTEFPKFTVSVFLNGYAGSMFHPKVCWFGRTNGGALVTGSGNLTEGGLSKNWEAFTVTDLAKSELTSVQAQWSAWRHSYGADLVGPGDASAIACAKRNKHVAAATESALAATPLAVKAASAKKALANKLPGNKPVGVVVPVIQSVPGALSVVPSSETAPAHQPLDVLIAEIPRGSSRWNQANFDLENYEGYFGAKVGTTRMMFFRHVDAGGALAATEIRPSVAVKSSNWRFELAAAAGLKYPTNGRPIAVFVKQASRNFLYRLLMPGDPAHSMIETLLDSNWHGPAGRIKRVKFSRSELEQAWPDSPLWKVPETEHPNV
jgi:hypothetical protein